MGKVNTRRVVRIFLTALFVIGALVGLFVLLTRDWGPKMSFGFLDGRTMTGRIEQARNSRRITRDVYSFQADFNDVCAKLDSELLQLGFTMSSGGNPEYRMRDYRRAKSHSIRWINIRITDKLRYTAFPSPDRWDCNYEEGWISIEIQRWRRQFWPPQRVLDQFHVPSLIPSRPPPGE